MTTITKTIKVKINSCAVTELADEYHLPYVVCRISIKKCLKTGKDLKIPECIPEGWQNWTYDECIEHNKNVKFQPTHINVLLKGSQFMVIDFDSKEDIPLYLHLFGDDWKSKSSARGLPHLWRTRAENDFSKCTTAITIDGKKTHIDLKYFNIFERIDSNIEYINSNIPQFDFEKYHNKPISNKPVPRENITSSNNYNLLLGDYTTNRFMSHLKNCREEDISTYSDWFKIGRAIKNVFSGIPLPIDGEERPIALWFEILISWSRRSKNHTFEDYDNWEAMFDGESKCGIPTILQYSQNGDEAKYDQIERDYYKAKRADVNEPTNIERKLLLAEGYKKLFESIAIFDKEQEIIKKQYPAYEDVKEEFEKSHFLIKNIATYIEERADGLVYYNAANFNIAHKMIKYWVMHEGKRVIHCFITKWTSDENMRKYDYCEIYPPPLTCPKDAYNLWRPFWISTLTGDYVNNGEALKMFHNHVDILCNHQEDVKDYILKWIGQMFKCPAVKTICPTFISEEGAGKGTLLEIIRKMMGDNKIMETTTPSDHVWGSFNELMADSFLVNLNEMCKKEALGAEGKIKGLITDNALYINRKGVAKYPIKSYHRFIITTNKEDPINTKKGDRRNLIIESSSELTTYMNPTIIKDYFVPLRKECLSTNGLRTIYDWLINQEDLEEFALIPMPKTEYQQEMKEAHKSYYELWLESFVKENHNIEYPNNILELKSLTALQLFTSYLQLNRISFDTNVISIGLALSRMKIPGITKKSKMNGAPFALHIDILRKHFMVGCQIEG